MKSQGLSVTNCPLCLWLQFTIYSDPQNHWYVYNIWFVTIISQQLMMLCKCLLYQIHTMHIHYKLYIIYDNLFSIHSVIINFLVILTVLWLTVSIAQIIEYHQFSIVEHKNSKVTKQEQSIRTHLSLKYILIHNHHYHQITFSAANQLSHLPASTGSFF